MNVTVKGIRPSRKESVLAEAVIELGDGQHSITVDDLRILRNKQGSLWVAMPSYAVPLIGGHGYQYRPTIALSRDLHREVEDAALAAFEHWERKV
jgi:DNA-binding cell septation regulator SpoVG